MLRRNAVILLTLASLLALLSACDLIATPAAPSSAPPQIGQRTKTSGCVSQNALPDPACTPGAIFPDATVSQICKPGYSSGVRDVPVQVKDQVYAEYGIRSHSPGQYEVDHLISLELGGSNDIANLWPEPADPRPGFHEKDQVENLLHDRVCSRATDLGIAQAQIAGNWLALYSGISSVPALLPTAAVQPTAAAQSSPQSTGKYVASSQAQKYYYCADDPDWRKLKSTLIWSDDPQVFIAKGLTLHQPCQ